MVVNFFVDILEFGCIVDFGVCRFFDGRDFVNEFVVLDCLLEVSWDVVFVFFSCFKLDNNIENIIGYFSKRGYGWCCSVYKCSGRRVVGSIGVYILRVVLVFGKWIRVGWGYGFVMFWCVGSGGGFCKVDVNGFGIREDFFFIYCVFGGDGIVDLFKVYKVVVFVS